MRFIIKLAIENDYSTETTEEVIQLNKGFDNKNIVGLSLLESKEILKKLQSKIILSQAKHYVGSKRVCTSCHKKMKIKGHCSMQYRTLFGIVDVPSPRLFHCQCSGPMAKTFSPLSEWLSDKNNPELQYIETK